MRFPITIAAFLLPVTAFATDVPGQHHLLSPDHLAAPHATPAVANSSRSIARPVTARLSLPPGFTATLFADRLQDSRWLAVAANGDVFLAQPEAGKVTLLRDADGDGKAEMAVDFAAGFDRPHGLAFHDGALYVGDMKGAWRLPYKDGDTKSSSRMMVTPPGGFGARGGNHWTRNLAFGPKGELMIAIGSAGNVGEEMPPRATVQLFQNGRLSTFASGTRNPVGIAFYPGTDDLYAVVNERDGLGDELVPDYLTRLDKGAFYGWPYAYIGPHPDPDYGAKRPDLVRATKTPDVLFQSHSAPLGLVFYDGTQFPAVFRGGAFVSFHGSWNAAAPTGYKIVYVPFKNGRPTGGYDDFAVGFWTGGTMPAQVMGRPVGLALARDGSLLVADDVGDAVWRITYKAP